MDSQINNAIFIFNEHFILFACDFVIIFSDYTPSITERHKLGYFYIAFILLSIAVNLVLIIYIVIIDIKNWLRLRKLRKAVQQELMTQKAKK